MGAVPVNGVLMDLHGYHAVQHEDRLLGRTRCFNVRAPEAWVWAFPLTFRGTSKRIVRMSQVMKDIWARRELLAILVDRNLKIRYKSSVLGFFWSLLGPLFLILIYSVFAGIMKFNQGRTHYLEFLVIGVVTWQFLAMCLGDSLYAIMGNVNLVKKTAFPRVILPLAMIVANLINFLLTFCVLLAYLLIARMPLDGVALLPFILLMQTSLCFGLALLLSTSNVFFRDTEHILGIITLAWFFLSPIFYPVSMQLALLPGVLRWAPFLNPMTGIVYSYRCVLMSNAMPDVLVPGWHLGISAVVCLAVLAAGWGVFQSCQQRFGDEL
jgi:lipopolysaccharide transport system permease protein